MSWELTRSGHQLSLVAASGVIPQTAVRLAGTSTLFALPCGSVNQEPFGVVKATAGASGLNQGEAVTIYEQPNITKMTLGASCGVAAEVGVGSTNGVLKPVVPATGALIWRVGVTLEAGIAGDKVAVYIKPDRLDSQF